MERLPQRDEVDFSLMVYAMCKKMGSGERYVINVCSMFRAGSGVRFVLENGSEVQVKYLTSRKVKGQ